MAPSGSHRDNLINCLDYPALRVDISLPTANNFLRSREASIGHSPELALRQVVGGSAIVLAPRGEHNRVQSKLDSKDVGRFDRFSLSAAKHGPNGGHPRPLHGTPHDGCQPAIAASQLPAELDRS